MYITNNTITFNENIAKTAQKLEVVKTPEAFTDRELTRAIRDAIIAEEDAIKQYETVVDASNNEDVKKVLTHIADEERVHVGELQELLSRLLPDEQNLLDEGAKEVIEEIGGTENTKEIDEENEEKY